MGSLLGAVLTGGASRRMGRDKALIEIDGVAMVDRIGAVLAAVCDDVVAVGPAALAGGLPAVADLYPGQGPLGGVITALRAAGDDVDTVVVVACDLPWLDASTVRTLVAALDDDIDVAVANTDRVEPMCAVWRRRVIETLEASFTGGERALHVALSGLHARAVEVPAQLLRNVNTPIDLAD